jgi:cleavage and polyadenylation specificity factor subunit 5
VFESNAKIRMSSIATRPKIDTYAVARYIVIPSNEEGSVEQRKDQSAVAKLTRLKRRYEHEGHYVTSVEGVIVVHVHNHPHILLLKRSASAAPSEGATAAQSTFRLPGGKVRGSESAADCLYRKLARDLLGHQKGMEGDTEASNPADSDHPFVMSHSTAATPSRGTGDNSGSVAAQRAGMRIGEVLAVWCRPSFDRAMYPYVPAHVSEPKELRTIFLVHMPSECMLAVTEANTELVAVPLFELYENAARYGALIASVPQLLSRFVVNVC